MQNISDTDYKGATTLEPMNATEMLHQILDVARQADLQEIHLSVERNNIPSVKTIVKKWRYL